MSIFHASALFHKNLEKIVPRNLLITYYVKCTTSLIKICICLELIFLRYKGLVVTFSHVTTQRKRSDKSPSTNGA